MTKTTADAKFDTISKSLGLAPAGPQSEQSMLDLMAELNALFPYDLFGEDLLAEGARELAREQLEWSDDTLAAGYEALPPE